jgi:ribonuclease P protein subunit RPR2
MPRSRKKPETWKKIAEERIKILFEEAEREFSKHPERSKRYVELARKIGMRYNIKLKAYRKKFCRKCNAYLKPGVNCRIRLRDNKKAIVQTCLECGNTSRHPYIKEKKIIKNKGEKI